MPIYEYLCSKCGHSHEAIQKFSEPPLSVCPACNETSLNKKLSAPSFHLKGSGWYVTDFKNNTGKKSSSEDEATKAPNEKESKPEKKGEDTKATPETKQTAKADSTSKKGSDAPSS